MTERQRLLLSAVRRFAPDDILLWLGRLEWPVPLALMIAAGAVWGFVELADAVVEGGTARFDRLILLALRSPDDPTDPIGPVWFEEMMRDFTALGGNGVLTLVTAVAIGFLITERKRRAAMFLLAAVAGGMLISTLVKIGFERPRPDLVPHGARVYTASFPSGHAMLSAVVYLTIATLVARIRPHWRVRAYILLSSVLLTVLVGVSRVYLGVHWPTDVLAGWAAGAAWALVCWAAARWLQYHGNIEPAGSRLAGGDANR